MLRLNISATIYSVVIYFMIHRIHSKEIATILVVLLITLAGCTGDVETTTTTKDAGADQRETTTTEATSTPEPTTATTAADADTGSSESNSGSLSFGETHTMKNGMAVTVELLEFRDSYYDGYSDYDAPPGKKWLFVELTAENTGESPAYGPSDYDVKALAGNTQYNPDIYIGEEYEAYEWAELQPGITEEGVIVYAVDEDVALDDLEIVWSEQYYTVNGDANVRWS